MNRKSIIAAAVLAAASLTGFAQEAEQLQAPASSLSRAEVRAELRELQAAGAWQPTQEASLDGVQAKANDIKIAQLPTNVQVAQENVPMDALDPLRSQDELMAWADAHEANTLVVPADSVVIIEVVPQEQADAATPDMAHLFHHPAIALESDLGGE